MENFLQCTSCFFFFSTKFFPSSVITFTPVLYTYLNLKFIQFMSLSQIGEYLGAALVGI